MPQQFIEDGKIVLNIRPQAVQGLTLGNEEIEFNARFSGKPMHIVTPIAAVMAIYAKENGKGMIFDQEDEEPDNTPPPENKPPSKAYFTRGKVTVNLSVCVALGATQHFIKFLSA